MKAIKYLCRNCAVLLRITGPDAVNEVGRKFCEGCGDNRDCLIVVDAEECIAKINKYNETNELDRS